LRSRKSISLFSYREAAMNRTPVASSDLRSVGYDAGRCLLEIEFVSGTVYQYSAVPESVFNGLMTAASKGRYFNQVIRKGPYPYVRVS
jgi:hypothetical protein